MSSWDEKPTNVQIYDEIGGYDPTVDPVLNQPPVVSTQPLVDEPNVAKENGENKENSVPEGSNVSHENDAGFSPVELASEPAEIKKKKKKKKSKTAKLPEAGSTDGTFEEKKNPNEDNLTDDPLDRNKPITERFEYAVNTYRKNHKFPGRKKDLFDDYLRYGGITVSQNLFQGGGKDSDDEGGDGSASKIGNAVVNEHEDSDIDFEGVAIDFLGRWFILTSKYVDAQYFHEAPAIVASFLRYLLVRRVCPEYEDNIRKAVEVADLAKRELPLCKSAALNLPGQGVRFNRACGLLFGGELYGIYDEMYGSPGRIEEMIGISISMARISVQSVLGEPVEKLRKVSVRSCLWVIIIAIEGGGAASEEVEEGTDEVIHIRKVTLKDREDEAATPFEILLESDTTKYLLPGFTIQADFHQLVGENEPVWYMDLVTKVLPTFYPGGEEDDYGDDGTAW